MSATQYYGTGRRKTARARVFLRPGNGKITVNSRELPNYFPDALHRMQIMRPLELTEKEKKGLIEFLKALSH